VKTNIPDGDADYKKFGTTDILMLSAMLFWAVNFSFVKIALRELSPLAFNGIRLAFASVMLTLILLLSGENLRVDRKMFLKLVALGLIGNTAYQMFFIHGIDLTTASNSAIIIAMSPVVIALLSSRMKHERVHPAAWAGIIFSFLGFYLVISSRFGALEFSSLSVRGDLMIFGGNICWAVYTVFSKSILDRMTPLKLTTLTMIVGTVFFLPFCVMDISRIPYAEVSFKAWGSLFYSGLFALVICYVIWYASVQRVGNTKTAIYNYLIPVFTVIFAYFIIKERITLQQALGALIIFVGVYLVRIGYTRFLGKNTGT
jgi:drug/metabolite transporter (DMT)-like permease